MANNYPNVTRAVTQFAVGALVFLIVGLIAGSCMTTSVRSGEAAVKYSIFGGTDLDRTYGEGLNVHAPWVDVIRYDVRINEELEEITALSSNGLTIDMDASIRWRPVSSELPRLHTTYGTDYYRKLVQPVLRSAVREVVGQFTEEELYSSKRSELQQEVFDRVRDGVDGQYVQVEAVLIRDVILPEQIQRAIERKLQEEQEAERYEFTLQKEELEAQRKRIEAEGQAEYQRIINQNLTPNFLQYEGVRATQALAESANSKTIIIGGENGLPVILGNQ